MLQFCDATFRFLTPTPLPSYVFIRIFPPANVWIRLHLYIEFRKTPESRFFHEQHKTAVHISSFDTFWSLSDFFFKHKHRPTLPFQAAETNPSPDSFGSIRKGSESIWLLYTSFCNRSQCQAVMKGWLLSPFPLSTPFGRNGLFLDNCILYAPFCQAVFTHSSVNCANSDMDFDV